MDKLAGPIFNQKFVVKKLQSGETVLLSENKNFILSSPEYVALTPLLNGVNTPDQLVDILSPSFAPERIYYALIRLQSLGLTQYSLKNNTQRPATGALICTALKRENSPRHIHIYSALVHQTLASRLRSKIILPPIKVSGWSENDNEAKIRCTAEAEERGALISPVGKKSVRSSLKAIKGLAFSPNHLARSFSFGLNNYDLKTEYKIGEEKSSPVNIEPYQSDVEIDWVAAHSVTKDQEVWIPSSFCYFAPETPEDQKYSLANSTGCAAGNTIDEAVVRGFLELIERDAIRHWSHCRTNKPPIAPHSIVDNFYQASARALEQAHRTLLVFNLDHYLGVNVIAAASWRKSDFSKLKMGFGASFNSCSALQRAIGELNQTVYGNDEKHSICATPSWLVEASISKNHPFFCSEGQSKAKLKGPINMRFCVELLGEYNKELIILDQSLPDSQYKVVRTIIPNLSSQGNNNLKN